MPEKDPSNYSYITYLWVTFLASWGGFVSFLRKRKSGDTRPFNFMELIGELVTSAFAGIVTFFLCEWSETPKLLTVALVAISGTMGSRTIYLFEKWVEKKAGQLVK